MITAKFLNCGIPKMTDHVHFHAMDSLLIYVVTENNYFDNVLLCAENGYFGYLVPNQTRSNLRISFFLSYICTFVTHQQYHFQWYPANSRSTKGGLTIYWISGFTRMTL